jgi:MFS family permease
MSTESDYLVSRRPRGPVVKENNFEDEVQKAEAEKALRLKVDLRLCTIAGLLCSLNLLDSGIISSASVTSMLKDLQLDQGNRYSVSILIFTVASVCFQLPATLAVRILGPRIFFATIAFGFGLITLCTAFITTWKDMIAMRVLLGIFMSGVYPGLALLISSWYRREELQLRFAFLQCGEVIVLATGGIVNFGLNNLNGRGGLKGWQWMYVVQGLMACIIGIATYWWIIDFPENAEQSFYFLDEAETKIAVARIQDDRGDVQPTPFSWPEVLTHFLDPKVYAFAATFFLLNLVSTALSYFLPIILQNGMGFSTNQAILLSAPPYYYAVIPVLISSRIGDKFRLRGPVITFNSLCLIAGFCMLGFSNQVTVRYIGTYLATGAYISNWAALNSYQASNITGQWKRVVTAAAVTACNGLGGVAGSFIVRRNEAPRYPTAVWVSIG